MPTETVFTIANTAVLPFWVLLLILPHHKITNILVHSGLIAVVYGLLYAGYLVNGLIMGGPEGAGMDSLQGLIAAFSVPEAMLAGWIHYLVFDLFVGAWMVRDAKRHEIPHWTIAIPLILTLMAGPFGLLLYLALRGAWKRHFSLIEAA